jgi:hypothetical protein
MSTGSGRGSILRQEAPRARLYRAKSNRSRLISDAVTYCVSAKTKSNLAERLKQGALVNTQRDLELAREWFPLEEEAWQREHRRHRPSLTLSRIPPRW